MNIVFASAAIILFVDALRQARISRYVASLVVGFRPGASARLRIGAQLPRRQIRWGRDTAGGNRRVECNPARVDLFGYIFVGVRGHTGCRRPRRSRGRACSYHLTCCLWRSGIEDDHNRLDQSSRRNRATSCGLSLLRCSWCLSRCGQVASLHRFRFGSQGPEFLADRDGRDCANGAIEIPILVG